MIKHRTAGPSALVAAAAACAFGLTAGQASAAAATFHDHLAFPAAGAVFACAGGDLIATAGTVDEVDEITEDAQGIFHITGTVTAHGVTVQDATGNTYTVTGAASFSGKSAGEDAVLVTTDTTHFVVHNADGGVYAKVQAVEHLSPNGKVTSLDFGSCEQPAQP